MLYCFKVEEKCAGPISAISQFLLSSGLRLFGGLALERERAGRILMNAFGWKRLGSVSVVRAEPGLSCAWVGHNTALRIAKKEARARARIAETF